jgi:glutamine synthetase type III
MERTLHYIKVWFWERNDPFVPWDVSSGAWIVDTNNWVSLCIFFELCLYNIVLLGHPCRQLP